MLKEFKEFIAKGNAIDLAVGVVLGAAFGAVVASLVDDLLMPLVGLLLGGADFSNVFAVLKDGTPAAPYATLAAAQEAGAVTLNAGLFVNALVALMIIGLALFFVVKGINKIRKPADPPAMKECGFCLTSVPEAATRCPACTSELG
jgi:large conductance mechanosensitive channel